MTRALEPTEEECRRYNRSVIKASSVVLNAVFKRWWHKNFIWCKCRQPTIIVEQYHHLFFLSD